MLELFIFWILLWGNLRILSPSIKLMLHPFWRVFCWAATRLGSLVNKIRPDKIVSYVSEGAHGRFHSCFSVHFKFIDRFLKELWILFRRLGQLQVFLNVEMARWTRPNKETACLFQSPIPLALLSQLKILATLSICLDSRATHLKLLLELQCSLLTFWSHKRLHLVCFWHLRLNDFWLFHAFSLI